MKFVYLFSLLITFNFILASCATKTRLTEETSSKTSFNSSSSPIETTATTYESISVSEIVQFPAQSLIDAVSTKNLVKVRQILKDKAYNLNETNNDQNTPLHLAVQQNEIEIAKLLIDAGANVNLQNQIQDSSFLYAGAEGKTEILDYMLQHSQIDFTVVNRFGGNALIPAAEKGHLENVRLLLEDGRSDIDFQNNFGYTALIEVVALRENTELYHTIAQTLIEAGANTEIRDHSNRSAIDYAKSKNNPILYEMIP